MPELWQGAIERIGPLINVGHLHVLDVDLLKVLFTELHLVGERPSVAERDSFLAQLWPGTTPLVRREYTDLWQKLQANPLHRFRRLPRRGYPLRHPFLILDEVAKAHSLSSVGERIVMRIAETHARLIAMAGPSFDLDTVARIDREALALEWALRVWIRAQVDTRDESIWGPYTLAAPREPSPAFRRSPYERESLAPRRPALTRDPSFSRRR